VQAEQPEFSVSKRTVAGWEVISVYGELDALTAPELTDAIDALDGSALQVVVDLSELSFIDSSGLHTLMRARPGGRPISVVCPNGNISRLLEIVKADRMLRVYKQLDDLITEHADGHPPRFPRRLRGIRTPQGRIPRSTP
jgi:anti-sigma B factor antagonist